MTTPAAGKSGASENRTQSTPEDDPDRAAKRKRRQFMLSCVVIPVVILAAAICCVPGCGESAPAVDPGPFEAAIATYLTRNDMALRIKKIRRGPTIDGDQATMSASMTHRELGGPSVVWTFQFQRAGPEQWSVLSHSDK